MPGQHHTRIGIPVAGDRHRDHDLGQIIAMILAVPAHPERLSDDVAVLVEDVLLGLVALEVGRGRVKEQQVDLEIEQIGGREVHRLGELVLHLQQPIHRAVTGVLIELGQAGDPRAL